MEKEKHEVFKKDGMWLAYCPAYDSVFRAWEWRQAIEHVNYCTCVPRRYHDFLMGRGRWR